MEKIYTIKGSMGLHSSVISDCDGKIIYRNKLKLIGIPKQKYTVTDHSNAVALLATQDHSISRESFLLTADDKSIGHVSDHGHYWLIELNDDVFEVSRLESGWINNKATFEVRKSEQLYATIQSETLCWTVAFENGELANQLLPALSVIHGRFINED